MFSDRFLSESNILRYNLQAILNYPALQDSYTRLTEEEALTCRLLGGISLLWFTKIFTFKIFFPSRMLSDFFLNKEGLSK